MAEWKQPTGVQNNMFNKKILIILVITWKTKNAKYCVLVYHMIIYLNEAHRSQGACYHW